MTACLATCMRVPLPVPSDIEVEVSSTTITSALLCSCDACDLPVTLRLSV